MEITCAMRTISKRYLQKSKRCTRIHIDVKKASDRLDILEDAKEIERLGVEDRENQGSVPESKPIAKTKQKKCEEGEIGR